MPSVIQAQLKDRISSFITELDQLVRKSTLEALHGILAGDGKVTAPTRTGKPGRFVGGRRGRPTSANVEEASAKVLAHVQANDGQGISAIASATGLDLTVAKRAAASLLAAGSLKKSGQKRGTIYHVGSGRPARAAKTGKRRGRKKA